MHSSIKNLNTNYNHTNLNNNSYITSILSGFWGEWSLWTECSAPCNGGIQSRVRDCVNGQACVGDSTQTRECNKEACSGKDLNCPWNRWQSNTLPEIICGWGLRKLYFIRESNCIQWDKAKNQLKVINCNVSFFLYLPFFSKQFMYSCVVLYIFNLPSSSEVKVWIFIRNVYVRRENQVNK